MSYIEFVAGCNGGLFGVLVGHPFDTVKVKLQLTGQSASAMFRNESIRTLYRGVSSPLLFLTSINAIVFGTHANLKRLFTEEQQKSLFCEFTCGFLVGATQSIISSPMELLKSRLQATSLQANADQKVNLIRDVKKLRKDYPNQNIFRSLYRGYGTTFWRDSPAFGIYFSSYEYFLRYMNPNDRKDEPSNFVVLASGGIAGVLSWFLTYPMDVIKTQIQLNPGLTVRNFLRQTHREVGLKGLTRCLSRGLGIACVRAAYCNAVTFYCYHLTVKWMVERNL